MNVWNGIGNITKDVNLEYITGNEPVAVARMTRAVNDGDGDKRTVSYIPIKAFGKMAENCERYLHKGSKISVTGRIETGSYEKDGRIYYTWEVIASNIEFHDAR